MAQPSRPQRGRRFESGKPKPDDMPLADRWLKALKNNPFIAALLVVGVCITGAVTFYKALPDQVQAALISLLPFGDTKTSNGWAWAGTLDKDNVQTWAIGPFVTIIRMSDAAGRGNPLKSGDVVTPKMDIPQTIIDFKTRKNDNVLIAPTRLRTVIHPDSDYTGMKFKAGQKYTVVDVVVASVPDSNPVVWLRLITAD